MGDFPLMTEKGTFIYNGAERVVVTQLVRSPGPYYDVTADKSNNKLFSTTIIPNRGAWLEYETDSNEIISVRVDRTRKQPVSYTHLQGKTVLLITHHPEDSETLAQRTLTL